VILNSAKFGSKDLKKAKYDVDPLEDGRWNATASSSRPREADQRDARGKPPRHARKDCAARTCRALGVLYWLYNRDMQPTLDSIERQVRQEAASRRRQHRRPQGRLQLRDHDRGLPDAPTRSSRPGCRAAPTATSWATRRCASARRREPQARVCRSCSAATRSRRRATSCISCRSYKHHGVMTFQAEDEIAAVVRRDRREYAGQISA
jgi:hypothetical protein